MKKISYVLAILATICTMSSVAMAKSFSDVKNTKYVEAVNLLTELNIVSGYEDGTYKPENSVKRSEMAKLIVTALGKEQSAKSLEGTTKFSDVTSKHWACGYVNLASSLNLIKGYPDGTFHPDDSVSYVEACTMLLRALNYGKELDNLAWPTGYMEKANNAGILKNVVSNSSSDKANRGNVASMVYNTLKANTRKVVATNSTGSVYGNDEVLIEKAFGHYIQVIDGLVTDIDVEKEELTIEDKKNNREIEVSYTDSSDIKKLFGRTVTFLYDKKEKDFISFETTDKQTVKKIEVYDVDVDEDTIYDEDEEEYEIPKKSNLLMLGISNVEDADTAYITLDAKGKVTYMVLEGTEKVYVGIVTKKSVTIGKEKGIEIQNTSDKKVKYVLATANSKVSNGDIVIYTVNSDDEATIQKYLDIGDADEISSKTSSSIKIDGESKLSFSSSSDYKVYFIEDEEYISTGKLSSINTKTDVAAVEKYNDVYYIFVFEDGLDDDDEDDDTDLTVTQAKKLLKTAITNGEKKLKSEASYTVKSIEKLRAAVETGNKIYNSTSSYSAAKIETAAENINDAISDLLKAKTADKELRAAFAELEAIIAKAEKLVAEDYTEDSYKKLTTAVTAGKKITIASTTVEKVTAATENIDSAINLLVTNTSAEQVAKAIARLNAAIAEAKTKRKAEFTEETYTDMEKALETAQKLNVQSAAAREIDNVAENLENAIDALVSYEEREYNLAKEALEKNLKEAEGKEEELYTAESWEDFYPVLQDAQLKYEEIKKLTSGEIKKLNASLEDALKGLVLKTEDTYRKSQIKDIQSRIETFETKYKDNEEAWKETGLPLTLAEVTKIVENAKDVLANVDNYTTDDLAGISDELSRYIL